MQVDPRDAPGCAAVCAQHAAQRAVAPGGCLPSKEHAAFKLVLPAGDRCLPGRFTLGSEVVLHRSLVVCVGRPLVGQQQRRNLTVARVHGQGLAVVLEIAVQVHVLMRGTAQVRKTVGIQRMHVEHRHAGRPRLRAPFLVVQRKDLHTAAAVAFDAVAGAADDEQLLRICRAISRHVHGERLAVAPRQRMRMRFDRQSACGCSLQKLHPGAGIAGGKGLVNADHRGSFTRQPPQRPAIARSGEPNRWRPAESNRR